CAVVAGEWLSSYDGRTTEDPAALDINHVVALAEAWRSGAAAWDDGRRRAFANDLDQPGELVAVTAAANRSKGDHDLASWRPPNRASWCEFGIGWVRTKLKWGLTADRPEVRAPDDMLRDCSTEPQARYDRPASANSFAGSAPTTSAGARLRLVGPITPPSRGTGPRNQQLPPPATRLVW